jgi:hypothetical protein
VGSLPQPLLAAIGSIETLRIISGGWVSYYSDLNSGLFLNNYCLSRIKTQNNSEVINI